MLIRTARSARNKQEQRHLKHESSAVSMFPANSKDDKTQIEIHQTHRTSQGDQRGKQKVCHIDFNRESTVNRTLQLRKKESGMRKDMKVKEDEGKHGHERGRFKKGYVSSPLLVEELTPVKEKNEDVESKSRLENDQGISPLRLVDRMDDMFDVNAGCQDHKSDGKPFFPSKNKESKKNDVVKKDMNEVQNKVNMDEGRWEALVEMSDGDTLDDNGAKKPASSKTPLLTKEDIASWFEDDSDKDTESMSDLPTARASEPKQRDTARKRRLRRLVSSDEDYDGEPIGITTESSQEDSDCIARRTRLSQEIHRESDQESSKNTRRRITRSQTKKMSRSISDAGKYTPFYDSVDEEPPLTPRKQIRRTREASSTLYSSLSVDEEPELKRRPRRRVAPRARKRGLRRRKSSSLSSDEEDHDFIVDDEVIMADEVSDGSEQRASGIYATSDQPEKFGNRDFTNFMDNNFREGWLKRQEEKEEIERVRQSQSVIRLNRPPESSFNSPTRTKPQRHFNMSLKKCTRLYCRAIQKSVKMGCAKSTKAVEEDEEIAKYIFSVDKVEELVLAAEGRNHLLDGRWQTDLLQALNHRPYLKIERLEECQLKLKEVHPHEYCDACHYRKHIPEYVLRFTGPRTTPQKLWPMFWETRQQEDIRSEEEEEEEELFFVGPGCGNKPIWYHRAVWLRDVIARKAKEGMSTGRLKKGGQKAVDALLYVAKKGEHMKKLWASLKTKAAAWDINPVIEDDEDGDRDPWDTEDLDGSASAKEDVVTLSSSDESERDNAGKSASLSGARSDDNSTFDVEGDV